MPCGINTVINLPCHNEAIQATYEATQSQHPTAERYTEFQHGLLSTLSISVIITSTQNRSFSRYGVVNWPTILQIVKRILWSYYMILDTSLVHSFVLHWFIERNSVGKIGYAVANDRALLWATIRSTSEMQLSCPTLVTVPNLRSRGNHGQYWSL
jgi:hypothetical protein